MKISIKDTFDVETEFQFTSENANFVPQPEHNEFYIKMQQQMYNDRLRIRGYVFLNEILNSLGIEVTPVGQIIGWTRGQFIVIEIKSSHYKGTNLQGYVLKIVTEGNILGKMMEAKHKELVDA